MIQAERAFFKINEQGVPLTDTDKILLHSRRCPNAIASRAINQRGTGHPYWGKFNAADRNKIQKLAVSLHKSLFTPDVLSPTVRTPDLPVAGKYTEGTSLGLLLQTINLANNVKDDIPVNVEEAEKLVPPDIKGNRTVDFLKNTQQVVTTISNREETDFMRSLDLHPLVYFYSERGKHLPSAFLATVEMIRGWSNADRFITFTKNRQTFEEILVKYKDFLQQISRNNRGGIKAVHKIRDFFEFLIEQLENGGTEEGVISSLSNSDFPYLKLPSIGNEEFGPEFKPQTKSQINIKDHLEKAVKCEICEARVPNFGISFDHKTDKALGGKGNPENAARSHHYCNSRKNVLIPLMNGAK